MVAYPTRPPMDPFVAKALRDQREVRPSLDFQPVNASFVSKHTGGRPVAVTRVSGFYGVDALIYKTPLNTDFDGAPDSYAPPISATDLRPQGGVFMREKSLKNATNEKDPNPVFHNPPAVNTFRWTGVRSAPAGSPRIDDRAFLKDHLDQFPRFQPAGSQHAGYYAPQTAMNADDGQAVNALAVPYAALGASMRVHGRVRLGDVGLAIRVSTGASTAFIYADAGGGSSTTVGEYSAKLVSDLFGGYVAGNEDISMIVFPRTSGGPIAVPGMIPLLLKDSLENLGLFANVEDLVERMANPQLGDPLFAGRRFIPPTGFRQNIHQAIGDEASIARANVRAALRRWGAPI
jgi:hypothetical protein